MLVFFFTNTPTTDIYTLSLHDALPISLSRQQRVDRGFRHRLVRRAARRARLGDALGVAARLSFLRLLRPRARGRRSEEHTSELQSRQYLVCRLLLEKKKDTTPRPNIVS